MNAAFGTMKPAGDALTGDWWTMIRNTSPKLKVVAVAVELGTKPRHGPQPSGSSVGLWYPWSSPSHSDGILRTST